MHKIGFIVNPIAGMGGRVGLKGTDGVINEAIKRGAKPVAPERAKEMLKVFKEKCEKDVKWLTCSGEMGEKELKEVGFQNIEIIYHPDYPTSSEDTKEVCRRLLGKVDIIVFCGGDGTARDIATVTDKKIPILGIPSGVKMHSGVFGVNPAATAKSLCEFLEGNLDVGEVEILDLDEELYRKGEWKIRLFDTVLGLIEPTYIQSGKATFESVSDEEMKEQIAEHIIEMMEKDDSLFILGSGSTLYKIGEKLGIEKTLLGIDAVHKMKLVGKDLDEKGILDLLDEYRKAKIILSPIGAQGFILGRGNLQISPEVVRRVGIDNIIVVATPSKLSATPILRVDTGDKNLDREFAEKGYMIVVTGYRIMKAVKIQSEER